jgi:hypothetical protein
VIGFRPAAGEEPAALRATTLTQYLRPATSRAVVQVRAEALAVEHRATAAPPFAAPKTATR